MTIVNSANGNGSGHDRCRARDGHTPRAGRRQGELRPVRDAHDSRERERQRWIVVDATAGARAIARAFVGPGQRERRQLGLIGISDTVGPRCHSDGNEPMTIATPILRP